jgi:hypothetical protein
MAAVEAEADGATWTLMTGAPESSVRIATRLEQGRALLGLPAGTARISSLPAAGLKRNALGAVQADVGGDWAQYVAEFADGIVGYAPPGAEDMTLPAAERPVFEKLAAELNLRAPTEEERLRRVKEYFEGFSYAAFREAAPSRGTTALADFLGRSKSGHCEYFAAATTLLLRSAGIPARYATGFAMLEYSPLERAYVVRARHAHAWVRAWVGGRWVDVDTTPPVWFTEEESHAPVWQPLADLFRWAAYRWSQRGELDVAFGEYALAGLLAAILGWRMTRGRRVRGASGVTTGGDDAAHPGLDSEFFDVERVLAKKARPRLSGEPVGHWLSSVSAAFDAPTRARLDQALELHLRYRFDPLGLNAAERQQLRELALVLTAGFAAPPARTPALG